jgi:hypothetical protein
VSRRLRSAVAIAAACAGLLLAAPSLASGRVYGVQSCTKPRVRPTEIIFECGDAGAYMQRIHWRRWGGSIAVGSGTYSEKSCVHSCARGPLISHHATVWLGSIGRCPGHGAKRFYERAKVSGVRHGFGAQCPL